VSNLRFARRVQRMQASTIREILKITQRPDIISFAGGLPAPELFPVEAFREAMSQTLRESGTSALQYDVTEGYAPLKEFLCKWLSGHGLRCTPERMMMTNGSQQALDLIGKVFLNPNDKVLVENPTYLGAIQSFNAYEARYSCVPMDSEGMMIGKMEEKIAKDKPRFCYLVPTFQNPSGITMTRERRKALINVSSHHKLLIVEDDPYGYLRFSGQMQPSLYSLAKGRGVIYLSTFSKILSPGIRLGFVIAEPDIIQELVLAKQAADLQPNSLIQRAVYLYCKKGHLDNHIPLIISSYRDRAGTMLASMHRYFPSSVRWVPPEGGMFVWCMLPKGYSAAKIFKKAIESKVAFVSGNVFHANGGGEETLRLNFTNSTPEQIEEGIKRLGKVFRRAGM
jgi:2-aminoadipate transaminase